MNLINLICIRIVKAATLSREGFEEIVSDKSATWQGLLVVIASAVATGIGALSRDISLVKEFPSRIVIAFIGWVFAATISYIIGAKLLGSNRQNAGFGEVARGLGYAQAPGLIRLFGAFPGIGPTLFVITLVWQLLATLVAIRQAFSYTSYLKPLAVFLIGFIPYLIIVLGFNLLLESSV